MYRFEEALKNINKEFIRLSEEERRLHDEIINALLYILIERMMDIDGLFAKMYVRPFYGGSYYDGLKITKPDEYDLDLLLKIPDICEPFISLDTTYPGHVTTKLYMDRLSKQPEGPFYKKLLSFLDEENYLNASKVRSWMESLITKTLNEYHGKGIDLKLLSGNVTLQVTMKKSGPANTFQVKGTVNFIKVKMDIDFVPCFVFRRCRYPIDVRSFEDDLRQDYFIVPKTPKDEDRLWRLSFQEQERVLINGKDRLKPALKLLKRLRDNLEHDIASYYLKTLFLWKCEEVDDSFWSHNSLSTVFMTMLKSYRDHLQRREIEYYWDYNLNLLRNLKFDTLANMTGRINRIIADIETKNNDDVIYKYLGKSKERNSSLEETSSRDASSFPTWAKTAIGGIAIVGLAAALTAAGKSHNRGEEERKQRQQRQNENQNNEEDEKCLLM